MKKVAGFYFALVMSSAVGFVAAPAFSQDVVVAVSAADLNAALANCGSQGACASAMAALVQQYQAAYPGVPVATIVAAIVAEIAAGYNSGAISPTLATTALETAANLGGSGLADIIQTMVANISAGESIDLEAVAEAGGSAN